MTEADWLAANSPGAIAQLLLTAPPRRLHRLTAAFLRRVWDDLPTDLTRTAVEATEQFARHQIGPGELARLRAADAAETLNPLWLALVPARFYADVIDCCGECPACETVVTAHEVRLAHFGPHVRAARAGVEYPHWIAAKAALFARNIKRGSAAHAHSPGPWIDERAAQFEVVRDVLGGLRTSPRFERGWRTSTVLALARGIDQDQVAGGLPILADALQDAGCDDEGVLAHCRESVPHGRGCWVIDLILGRG